MTATLPVRVTVLDTWDDVALDLAPETPVAELKRRALDASRVRRAADEYEVKYLGATVLDETASLASVGVVANAPLIVLPRHRRPAV